MPEYLPPCFSDACNLAAGQKEPHRNLCRELARGIIEAGGAGILETELCPVRAVFAVLGPEPEDSHIAELRDRLGIEYIEGDPPTD